MRNINYQKTQDFAILKGKWGKPVIFQGKTVILQFTSGARA